MDKGVLSAVLDANRRLPECGLVTLTWGNVSGRDPATGLVAIKPSGVAYDLLALEDLVIVDLDGTVRHGSLRPSSDTATHLELYRRFPAINGIVHTHSRCATVLCQIGCDLPVLGTTHADHFDGTVPLVRALTHDEVAVDYELYTGRAIADHFEAHGIDPMRVPAALQHHHAPFAWATGVAAALDNAIALEVCAEMALMAISAGSRAKLAAIPDHITRKHQDRKHGPNATYGQK
jgi:L-ribulose-5-phosphate 4-epimerase